MGALLPKGAFKIVRTVVSDKDKLKQIADVLGVKDVADLKSAEVDLVYRESGGTGGGGGKGSK